jgi:hypothetical protein
MKVPWFIDVNIVCWILVPVMLDWAEQVEQGVVL